MQFSPLSTLGASLWPTYARWCICNELYSAAVFKAHFALQAHGNIESYGSRPHICHRYNRSYLWQIWRNFWPSCMTSVADVEGARDQRSPKGQGLLRKEGPPTCAILSRNSVLLRFTRFLKGFRRALNKSHPAFVEHSTKAILLS